LDHITPDRGKQMKLDMGAAWSEAIALIKANSQIVLVVAGLFFFLPSAALTLAAPDAMANLEMQAEAGPEALRDAMIGFYSQYGWIFIIIGLLQAIGTLGLLALLRDPARPTLGEALKLGAKALLPYIAVQLIVGLALGLALVLAIGIGAGTGLVALGVVLGLIVGVLAIYVLVKISLVSPVIAIERVYNPVAAIKRSWQLTKGNSVRLFAFYLLLIIALVVVSSILTRLVGLVALAFGPEGALVVNGLFSAVLNAISVAIVIGVMAALHAQLAGRKQALSETFE
jgi:hypothetical protein